MRRVWMPLLGGLVVGMLMMAALPTPAANGDPLLLGRKNAARGVTKVLTRSGVVFEANVAGIPAATFNVVSGPPIAVDSSSLVDDLNADYVGGRHSYQLFVNWDSVSNDNIPDGTDWSTDIVVLVPTGGGALVMNGGVGWYNNTGGDQTMGCRFRVDGVAVPGSFRSDFTQHGEEATCTSQVLKTVGAGTHIVTFTTFATAPNVQLLEGSWYVLVLPS